MTCTQNRIPNDIEEIRVPSLDLCGSVLYHKTSEPPFYFRVSVNVQHNSTVVFLAEADGTYFKAGLSPTQQKILSNHTGKCVEYDSLGHTLQWCLYSDTHTNYIEAVWAMSNTPMDCLYKLDEVRDIATGALPLLEELVSGTGDATENIAAIKDLFSTSITLLNEYLSVSHPEEIGDDEGDEGDEGDEEDEEPFGDVADDHCTQCGGPCTGYAPPSSVHSDGRTAPAN